MNNSILSASIIIGNLLLADEAVTSRVNTIYPVVAPTEARLPYVCYRRTGLTRDPTKDGRAACTATVVVHCYAEHYGECVELAEAVRGSLDNMRATDEDTGITMRSCMLTDSKEGWEDDAFIQELTFTIKI